ncbi:hypothetical protein WOLCODRAFT_134917 [Wolfiporia cocos MD-104 SS10]|uniref:Uncharacterized protein n=1 Tax=Wolfiporia cocos (strain MD-104) TaxID=742152 RepID=A0A2H3IUK3_WOLCO|nr:hypothetical protein WOLCODRAFT_134917 [Wolfiporia cocos MD-104 SS10]
MIDRSQQYIAHDADAPGGVGPRTRHPARGRSPASTGVISSRPRRPPLQPPSPLPFSTTRARASADGVAAAPVAAPQRTGPESVRTFCFWRRISASLYTPRAPSARSARPRTKAAHLLLPALLQRRRALLRLALRRGGLLLCARAVRLPLVAPWRSPAARTTVSGESRRLSARGRRRLTGHRGVLFSPTLS